MGKDTFKDFLGAISKDADASAKDAPARAHAAAPKVSKPSPASLIEQWWHDRVHNSPVSRDTRLYNFMRAAVDELKRLFEHQE